MENVADVELSSISIIIPLLSVQYERQTASHSVLSSIASPHPSPTTRKISRLNLLRALPTSFGLTTQREALIVLLREWVKLTGRNLVERLRTNMFIPRTMGKNHSKSFERFQISSLVLQLFHIIPTLSKARQKQYSTHSSSSNSDPNSSDEVNYDDFDYVYSGNGRQLFVHRSPARNHRPGSEGSRVDIPHQGFTGVDSLNPAASPFEYTSTSSYANF